MKFVSWVMNGLHAVPNEGFEGVFAALADRVAHTDICCEVMGSDHCPVVLELE